MHKNRGELKQAYPDPRVLSTLERCHFPHGALKANKHQAQVVNAIMPSKKFPYLVINTLLMVLIAGAGCASKVGDECVSSAECPTGAICDVTVEAGYCTITPCDYDSCPSDSVCIQFSREESFCMAYCESSGDCRDGYTCRKDIEGPGFCYVPSEAPEE